MPSHKDITGNEIADKAAAADFDEDHINIIKVPFTDYNVMIKDAIKKLWENIWKETSKTKGQWYAGIQNILPIKPWYSDFDYKERKFFVIINRLRFGHCQTPAHLYRMNIVNSDLCKYCGYQGADIVHIVQKCPKFSLQRLSFVAELSEITENVPRQFQDLLRNRNFYEAVYKFIVGTVKTI